MLKTQDELKYFSRNLLDLDMKKFVFEISKQFPILFHKMKIEN